MSSATEPLTELLESLQARLAVVEGKLGVEAPASSSSSGSGEELPRAIRAYDTWCTESVQPFVDACSKLGGEAEKIAEPVKEAYFVGLRNFLIMATKCSEPAITDMMPKLAPLQKCMKDAQSNIQRNDWENHAKAVSESLQALSWVTVKPAPRELIESYIGGSDFWANKIRVQYKKTAPDQTAFCDSLKAILVNLMAFVKEHHLTGVTWTPKGGKVSEYEGSASAPAPAPAPANVKPPAPAPANAKAGLFSDLSKGLGVTSGLKKVTADMQTWKKEYKNDKTVPEKKTPLIKKTPTTAKAPVKRDPITTYANKKHTLEYHREGVITVESKSIQDSICIYNCSDCVIDVKGKCKAIVVDGCKKVKVLFDDLLSGIELVNCQRIQAQGRGKVPTVSIDKTDGMLFYLSRESLDTQFTQSKSSEMNISFPDKDGNYKEFCIPEQYVHRVQDPDGQVSVSSEVSELYA